MAFVGRQAELDAVSREVALALQRSVGRMVFVAGPAGAGKSTLVAEVLTRTLAEQPALTIARGRCLQSFGSGDPYLPFMDALRDLGDESTAGAVAQETLSGMLAELAPYWLQIVPVVGGLLSATFATAARVRGSAPAEAAPSREALFVQYRDVLKRLAQARPLLLFLDDLHWADQASVALLAHLARGIESLPVAIVGTFRTGELDHERHPVLDVVRELERESIATRVDLGDLDDAAIEALLAAEFGADVSEPLRRWVVETAGGNPLFVSEMARLLKQSGAALEQRGEWQLTAAVADLEVPRSAEAVIESRIQRLEPEAVRILQYASVEGNDFDSVVLAGLLAQDELELLDALEPLERRHQLIAAAGEAELPNGDVATLFRFRHALVQTVLDRQVVGKRRILLHRKAGELLETLYAGAAERVASRLARHFHQGRMTEPAYRYARLAADAARRVYAHWEAEEFYRVALETAPGDAERIELEERLGDVYNHLAVYDQGIACYARARELAPTAAGELRLRRKTVILERKAGSTPTPALLQQVRAMLQEPDAPARERCELLLELANLPNADGTLAAVEEAVRIAQALEEPPLLADALQQLAMVHVFGAGHPAEAFDHLERAQAIGRTVDDPRRTALYHNIAGIAYAKLGQYASARREFEGMLAIAERIGEPHRIAAACANLGAVSLRLGDWEHAGTVLRRARTINERRDRGTLVHTLLSLAEQARAIGDPATAVEIFQQLVECARELEHWSAEAVAHAGLGRCLLETGRLEEARECAWRAIAVVADREEWFEDRDVLETFLARLEVLDGRGADAARRLARAAEALRTVDVFLWAMVELERSELVRGEDPDGAAAILSGVISGTAKVQSPVLQTRIDALRAAFPVFAAPEGVP